jgi:hypothetical protein
LAASVVAASASAAFVAAWSRFSVVKEASTASSTSLRETAGIGQSPYVSLRLQR